MIKNVLPGVYALHGWVPGFIGDYLYEKSVTISAGTLLIIFRLLLILGVFSDHH